MRETESPRGAVTPAVLHRDTSSGLASSPERKNPEQPGAAWGRMPRNAWRMPWREILRASISPKLSRKRQTAASHLKKKKIATQMTSYSGRPEIIFLGSRSKYAKADAEPRTSSFGTASSMSGPRVLENFATCRALTGEF